MPQKHQSTKFSKSNAFAACGEGGISIGVFLLARGFDSAQPPGLRQRQHFNRDFNVLRYAEFQSLRSFNLSVSLSLRLFVNL
jgi:hypothetical protein